VHGKADWSSRRCASSTPTTTPASPAPSGPASIAARSISSGLPPLLPFGTRRRHLTAGSWWLGAPANGTGGSGMSPMSEHRAAATVDCMSTLDDWIMRAAGDLALPPDSITADLRIELLDVTRDVAHGVARVAGPLTCYLIGVAVGRGDPPHAALATLKASLAAQVVRQNEESDTHVERES